ncbi:MAG: PDZ domain-containing protein [Myxococcota bacterium]
MKRILIGVSLVAIAAVGWWSTLESRSPPSAPPPLDTERGSPSGDGSAAAPRRRGQRPSPVDRPLPIPMEQRARVTYTPDPDDNQALVGLEISGVTDAERTRLKVPGRFGRGVIIRSIHPDAPAVLAGLAVDDVIVRARRTSIDSAQQLRSTVGDREHTVLTVSRNGQMFHVVLHKPYIPPDAPN